MTGHWPCEYPELLTSIQEFNSLTSHIESNWKILVQNIDNLAATDSEKHLFFDSLELLPPRTYMEALIELVELRKSGNLSDIWLTRALFPQMRMNCILADNYRDPSVVALLQEVKAIPDIDAKLSDSIDRIISGEAKETFDGMREFEHLPIASLIENRVVESTIRPALEGESPSIRTIKNLWIHGWKFFVVSAVAIIAVVYFLIRRRKHQTPTKGDADLPPSPKA